MDSFELIRSATMAIRTNKTRSILTTLGIIIGVAAVILLVSIGAGLQNFVTEEFEALGANTLFVLPGKVNFRAGPPGFGAEPKFDFSDVERIGRLGSPIKDSSGIIVKPVTIEYLNKSADGSLAGVNEIYLEVGNVKVEKGSFITAQMVSRSQMAGVVGANIAEKLFRKGEDPIGKEIEMSGKKIKVVGVLAKKGGGIGGANDENTYVFVPVTAAVRLTGSDRPATIFIRTNEVLETGKAAEMVKKYFYRKGLEEDDFTVMEPKELLESITSFLGVVTAALSGIAAISLVVGGIGIANIMLVSVTERTREIGLRKAIGATKGDILRQFLIEAVMLSVLGGGVGIALGWGLATLMSRFIETAVTMGTVALAFGVSAGVGILAGFLPAVRAARLDPIEALRYE